MATRIDALSVTRDEGASLHSVNIELGDLLEQSRVQDLVFLPYYLLLKAWTALGGDATWTRVLSLLAYAGVIYVVGRTAAAWATPRWGLVASVVTATHSLLAVQAVYARSYALSALAATAAVYGLARTDLGRRGGCALFLTGCVAACLLHQFAVLGPLAALAAVAFRSRWPVRRFLRLATPPVLVLLTVGALSAQQRGQISWMGSFELRIAAHTVLAPYGIAPLHGAPQAVLVLVAVVVAVVAARQLPSALLGAVAWLAAPALALAVVSVIHPMYAERYVTASAPALGLVCALGGRLATQRGSLATRCVAVLSAAIIALGVYGSERLLSPDKSAGFRQAAPACSAASMVVLPNHMAAAAFSEYLPPATPTWPTIPQPYLERLALEESADAFAAAGPTVNVCGYVNPYDVEALQRFERALVAAGYRKNSESRFGDVFVRRYSVS